MEGSHRNSLTSTSGDIKNGEAFGSQASVAAGARASVSGSEAALGRGAPLSLSHVTPPPQSHRDPAVTEERRPNELTRRVQKFRRRRASLRGSLDTGSTLEFDFEEETGVEADASSRPALVRASQPGGEFDVVLGAGEQLRESPPALDSTLLRREGEPLELQGPVNVGPEGVGLQVETRRRRRFDPGEVSIVMESSTAEEQDSPPANLPVAPLGPRFLAGVADGLMLLLALAFFVAIFWWAVGGRLHWRPVHLVVLGFVAGILVLSYFALFGRLASATPGQQGAGLALRSLRGGAPTQAQVLWRAFGYLVSSSALMLGFVWALVDSQGLTWHDRMSGTFLAARKPKL